MAPSSERESLRHHGSRDAESAAKALDYARYKSFDLSKYLQTVAQLRIAEALERIADAMEPSE